VVHIRVINHLNLALWYYTVRWFSKRCRCILTCKRTHYLIVKWLIAIFGTQRELSNLLLIIVSIRSLHVEKLVVISSNFWHLLFGLRVTYHWNFTIFLTSWRIMSTSRLHIFIILLSMIAYLTLLIQLWKILLLLIIYLWCFPSNMLWLVALLWW